MRTQTFNQDDQLVMNFVANMLVHATTDLAATGNLGRDPSGGAPPA